MKAPKCPAGNRGTKLTTSDVATRMIPRMGAIRSMAEALLDRRVLKGVQARAVAEQHLCMTGVMP